jgi:hypothetical protein
VYGLWCMVFGIQVEYGIKRNYWNAFFSSMSMIKFGFLCHYVIVNSSLGWITCYYTKCYELLAMWIKKYNRVLLEMTARVLTTCPAQYTWNSSIGIFLFNRKNSKFFIYLTGALYGRLLWFYKHQHDNRVCLYHVNGDGFNDVAFPLTHAPCLLKLCKPPWNGIVRWWFFPEFSCGIAAGQY